MEAPIAFRAALALWLAAMPWVAPAAMFKCVGKDGAISYQAEPCPVAADEKKMREVAPGPATGAPGKAASRWKDGWDDAAITAMADSCVPGVIGPARKAFASARKGEEFPEGELTPQVKAMCSCFAKRAGANYARADFVRDRSAILGKMNQEALGGGACKPEGLLGEMMGRPQD
jgi:hypothetical protein